MAYAQRSDLNLDDKRLAELTDSAAAQGVIDYTLVDRALDDAAAYIDGILFARYVTPLQPIPPAVAVPRIVVLWNRDIARYYLYQRRETLQIPESIAGDHARAVKQIQSAGEGDSDIVLPCQRVQSASEPSTTGGVLDGQLQRKFGRKIDGLV